MTMIYRRQCWELPVTDPPRISAQIHRTIHSYELETSSRQIETVREGDSVRIWATIQTTIQVKIFSRENRLKHES